MPPEITSKPMMKKTEDSENSDSENKIKNTQF